MTKLSPCCQALILRCETRTNELKDITVFICSKCSNNEEQMKAHISKPQDDICVQCGKPLSEHTQTFFTCPSPAPTAEETAEQIFRRCCKLENYSASLKVHNLAVWTAHEYATTKTQEIRKENDKLQELIKAKDEYLELILAELNEVVGMAAIHGWKSSRVEAGKILREKIKKLKL